MTRIALFRRVTLAALITLAFGPVAAGQNPAVSMHFVATSGPNPNVTMAASDTAGVTTTGVAPLSNWNNVSAANGTYTNLSDFHGFTTSVSVTIAGSPNTWSTGNVPNTADGRMMANYIDTSSTSTTTVTVSGLSTAGFTGTYHVLVYAVGDANSGRVGDYTIGAQSFRLIDDQPFNGTFRQVTAAGGSGPGQSGNYMDFTVSGDSFSLTAMAADPNGTGGTLRAPINAIEVVVPTPEPGAILCAAALGLGGIAAARRRFRMSLA
jgi:hypothetical protein